MKYRVAYLAFPIVAASFGVAAAPSILTFEGPNNHMATVVVQGQGFGSKPVARPAVWEDCSSGALSNDWTGAWPNSSANPNHNTACRQPIQGVELPHSNVTRYVAGSHAEDGGYNAGYDVMLYKSRTVSTYPAYTYASWYQRVDDAWAFCGDNNFKLYDYSVGTSPYDPENWYLEYNSRPTSRTSGAAWHLNDNGNALQSPDANGRSWWWESGVNPMSGQWAKVEVEIRYARDSSGYIKVWENGVLKVNYAGRTDGYSGSQRAEGIGGYARCSGPNNWRYFSDVYLDHSRARVILTDHPDYSRATILEPQIPVSWANNRVEVQLNLGRIRDPNDAYIFVIAEDGSRNSVGYKMTGGTPAPMAPTGVRLDLNAPEN